MRKVSPYGGEVIPKGERFLVRWRKAQSIKKVTIMLNSGGKHFRMIAASGTGFFEWKVNRQLPSAQSAA